MQDKNIFFFNINLQLLKKIKPPNKTMVAIPEKNLIVG